MAHIWVSKLDDRGRNAPELDPYGSSQADNGMATVLNPFSRAREDGHAFAGVTVPAG